VIDRVVVPGRYADRVGMGGVVGEVLDHRQDVPQMVEVVVAAKRFPPGANSDSPTARTDVVTREALVSR
jgi:hypothetical protein